MSPSSSIRDFAQYAGRHLWPRSASELTDTTLCPACLTRLPSPVCASCGLDLRHPAARELLGASTDAATALHRRVELIGRIRFDVAAARSAAEAQQAKTQTETHAASVRREALEAAARDAAAAAAARSAAPSVADAVAQAAARAASLAAAHEASLVQPRDPSVTAAAESRTAPIHAAPTQAAPAAFAPPVPHASVPPASAPHASVPPASAPPASVPPAPTTTAGPPARRRSSVQIVLLIVGVSLVSVAAIFFLTVAWFNAGLAFRSVVVGAFTLATLATAALLRRRRLVSTAEGIGALAVVLVLLDVWALRRNNLGGLGATDALLYWGVALLVCTALFLLWHAMSNLRVASVAGFATAAPGLGLLAAGLATDAPPLTRFFLAALGVAAGTLVHRFTLPGTARFWPAIDRRAERAALLILAGLALVSALAVAGFVQPGTDTAPLLSFGAVAVLAVAQAVTMLTSRRTDAGYRAAASASVGLAGLAVVLGVIAVSWRTGSTELLVSVPLLTAAVLALGGELAWRRRTAGPTRQALLTGTLTATVLATALGLLTVLVASVPLAGALVSTLDRATGPLTEVPAQSGWALATLAGVAALAAGFWRAGAVLASRLRILAWFGAVALLLAVPFTQWLWLILPLYGLLGAGALAALLIARRRTYPLGGYRRLIVTVLWSAGTLGYLIGWSSSTSWWLGTLSAVLMLVLARLALDRETHAARRGALLCGAIVLGLIGSVATPIALTLADPPVTAVLWLLVALSLGLATALVQVFAAQNQVGGLTTTERRWAFWTLFAPTLVVLALPLGLLLDGLSFSERAAVAPVVPVAGVVVTVLVVAALLLWALGRDSRAPGTRSWERLTAALLVAPALLSLTLNLVLITDAPAAASVLAAPVAALVTVALALVLRLGGRRPAVVGLELGAALVLASAFLRPNVTEFGWLVLLITGVILLLAAVDTDGLFASRSWRRHLGWLAVVTATAALWWGLASAGTTPVEAYVLPLAGLLLLLAALLWRFGRVDRAVAASPGSALLTLAGLVVALLPLAVTGQTGSVLRPVIVGGASAVLLVGASVLRNTPPRSAYLAAMGLAGALGLLTCGIARSQRIVTAAGPAGPAVEAWLLPTVGLLILAAALLLRQPDDRPHTIRSRASTALLLVGLVTLTLLEAAAFDSSVLGAARPLVLVPALSVFAVVAFRAERAHLGAVTAWPSLVLAGVAASAALLAGAVQPFELVTVPVALALAAGQLVRVRPSSAAADIPATGGTTAPVGSTGLAESAGMTGSAGSAPSVSRPLSASSIWIGVGLALAVLPSALAAVGTPPLTGGTLSGITADGLRQIGTLAVGGVLALAGAAAFGRARWAPLAWPAVLVGVATVIVTAAGRLQPLLATGPADGRVEAWLLPAALLLVVTGGWLITATPVTSASGTPVPASSVDGWTTERLFGYTLVGVALLGILGAETGALGFAPYAPGRAIALVVLFALVHVAVLRFDRSRAGTVLAWLALAAGLLSLVAGAGRDLFTPIELGTVPLGLALVAGQLVTAGLLRAPLGAPASRQTGAAIPASARLRHQGVVAVGLALALLPSAVAGGDGTMLRPVLVLVAAGALGILGARLVAQPRWGVLGGPATLVGVFAVLVTAGLRLLPLYGTPAGPTGQLEAWLLPAAGLVLATGAGLVWSAGRLAAAAGQGLRRTGYGLAMGVVIGIVLAEAPALQYDPLATVRMLVIVWLLAAAYLAVFALDPSPLGRLLAWVTLAAAAAMLGAGGARGVPDPVELASVPLAVALIVSGWLHLGRAPAARSWGALAPGLLLLLVPSLLLDLTASPLWRVVGLGIVATAVLLLGVRRKLQAPFVLGSVVLLVHALAQLWPWIALAYTAVYWWLWLGIGGVLLIALAARYEQRIQNLKSVALRVSALR